MYRALANQQLRCYDPKLYSKSPETMSQHLVLTKLKAKLPVPSSCSNEILSSRRRNKGEGYPGTRQEPMLSSTYDADNSSDIDPAFPTLEIAPQSVQCSRFTGNNHPSDICDNEGHGASRCSPNPESPTNRPAEQVRLLLY